MGQFLVPLALVFNIALRICKVHIATSLGSSPLTVKLGALVTQIVPIILDPPSLDVRGPDTVTSMGASQLDLYLGGGGWRSGSGGFWDLGGWDGDDVGLAATCGFVLPVGWRAMLRIYFPDTLPCIALAPGLATSGRHRAWWAPMPRILLRPPATRSSCASPSTSTSRGCFSPRRAGRADAGGAWV